MIDWESIVEQYEDASNRLAQYRKLKVTARTRLITSDQQSKKQAKADLAKYEREFRKAAEDLMKIATSVLNAIRNEIRG